MAATRRALAAAARLCMPRAPRVSSLFTPFTMAAATPPAAPVPEPAVLGVPAEFSTGSTLAFESASGKLDADTVVIVGEAVHVQEAAKGTSDVATFLNSSPAIKVGLVDAATSPSDAASAASTLVPAGSGVQKVVVISLPKVAGRHNCAARPHAIRKALVSAGLSGSVQVVHVIPDSTRALPAALAVSRAVPAYSHKSAKPAAAHVRVSFLTLDGSEVTGTARMATLSSSVRMAGSLVDMPTSELHTDYYVEVARAVAAETGASIEVIAGEQLRERGYGGLWGVGQASVHLPALAILTFIPPGTDTAAPSVCMVGKGIVYDTGGLSIKTKTGMPGMKKDMGGSAGILGAFRSLALAGGVPGRPLHALLCLAENSVSKEAQRPDDVITLYSGKTVELNNTDAEGRLVLGDGVAHCVAHLNPAVVLDMATLTGAQGIATGRNHGALYCNCDELEAAAVAAGKTSGDLVHPLPYAPEFYRAEFRSTVADMKNSVADRANAQSSCAGQFVGNHLGDFITTGKWCHIDMAYPASSGERGTGFGVALLEQLAQTFKVTA